VLVFVLVLDGVSFRLHSSDTPRLGEGRAGTSFGVCGPPRAASEAWKNARLAHQGQPKQRARTAKEKDKRCTRRASWRSRLTGAPARWPPRARVGSPQACSRRASRSSRPRSKLKRRSTTDPRQRRQPPCPLLQPLPPPLLLLLRLLVKGR
ncbi:unnamed protein product, partial [Laminaria digitata]